MVRTPAVFVAMLLGLGAVAVAAQSANQMTLSACGASARSTAIAGDKNTPAAAAGAWVDVALECDGEGDLVGATEALIRAASAERRSGNPQAAMGTLERAIDLTLRDPVSGAGWSTPRGTQAIQRRRDAQARLRVDAVSEVAVTEKALGLTGQVTAEVTAATQSEVKYRPFVEVNAPLRSVTTNATLKLTPRMYLFRRDFPDGTADEKAVDCSVNCKVHFTK